MPLTPIVLERLKSLHPSPIDRDKHHNNFKSKSIARFKAVFAERFKTQNPDNELAICLFLRSCIYDAKLFKAVRIEIATLIPDTYEAQDPELILLIKLFKAKNPQDQAAYINSLSRATIGEPTGLLLWYNLMPQLAKVQLDAILAQPNIDEADIHTLSHLFHFLDDQQKAELFVRIKSQLYKLATQVNSNLLTSIHALNLCHLFYQYYLFINNDDVHAGIVSELNRLFN